MFKNLPSPAVLYLDRNSFKIFYSGLKDPIEVILPTSCLSDLEIKNPLECSERVKQAIIDAKIPSRQILIVLSPNVYFEKVFLAASDENFERDKQLFISSLPFAYVKYRVYRLGKEVKLIALNRELYETLISIFDSLEFPTLAVVPAGIYQQVNVNAFDFKLAKIFLKRIDYAMQNSLLIDTLMMGVPQQTNEAIAEKKKEKILISIFVLLLGILGIVFALNYATLFPQKKVVTETISTVTPLSLPPVPSPVVSEILVASQAAESVTIRVFNGSQIPGQAVLLKRKLNEDGFANVEIGNAPGVNRGETIILHSATMSALLIEKLLNIVQQVTPNIAVKQSTDIGVDTIITTGSNSLTP